MIVTHKISMDLVRHGIMPCIHVVQEDKYSRDLQIDLRANGVAFELPKDCTVLVYYRKPDGIRGAYDTMPDGSRAWSVSGNVVTVGIAPQICTAAGKVYITVSLVHGKAELSCFNVCLDVQRRCEAGLRSEKYVNITGFIPQPNSAEVGQYLRVSGIGRDGKVTALETVDEPWIKEHSLLAGRDEPDQHAIEAITGLEDTLADINAVRSDLSVNNPEDRSYVRNRTHWVEEIEAVPFDGDLAGKECYPMAADGSQILVKMSDEILSASDLVGRTLTANLAGEVYSFVLTESNIVDYTARGMAMCSVALSLPMGTSEAVFCVADAVTMPGVYLGPGVYFGYMSTGGRVMYVESLSGLKEEVVHKLDNRFIDAEWMANMATGKGTAIWAETERTSNIAGVYAEEGTISLEKGRSYLVVYNDTEYLCVCTKMFLDGPIEHFVLGNLSLLSNGDTPLGDDTGEPFAVVTFPSEGFIQCILQSLPARTPFTMGIYEAVKVPNKLPEKYLPEGYSKAELVRAVIEALPSAEEVDF